MAKHRIAYFLGLFFVGMGALAHSHAETWALYSVQTTLATPGAMAVINYPLKHLYEDGGVAMMGLGGAAFTLGLAAWLYPPRSN